MPEDFVKRDRTARLLGIAHLLHRHKHGLTAQQIAERVGMHVRTVYRDLRALDEEVGIGIWQDGNRYGAEDASLLPPLKLTLQEAVTLFLSARLMERYQDRRNPHVVSAFNKLGSILPAPVALHLHAAVAEMAQRPRDDGRAKVFDVLATAWWRGGHCARTSSIGRGPCATTGGAWCARTPWRRSAAGLSSRGWTPRGGCCGAPRRRPARRSPRPAWQ